jgi:glutathione synthase/RimK-type ligase-like ATP-grasp enzyme
MDTEQPSVLVLGSRYDISCDYVIAQLRRQYTPYLRLNSEDLPLLSLGLDPVRGVLDIRRGHETFRLTQRNVTSVYCRRPVFLRDYGEPSRPPFERFQRFQWAVFLRSLMVLDSCQWVNHPSATYLAEHKAVQLRTAYRIGFSVPETIIANSTTYLPPTVYRDDQIVAKGLDTVLLRKGSTETFGFTHILGRESIEEDDITAAPVLFQEPILNKTDVRVTVVGREAVAVSVTAGGLPIEGDWRTRKGEAEFALLQLPPATARMCVEVVSELGLSFGALDLALRDGEYYFLEINPTGEWAWLVDSAGLPLDALIAELLAGPS